MNSTSGSDPRLARNVTVTNGKGGVLKTSTVANVAGQLARANYRTLAVDLDLSGNLGLDLGYTQRGQTDDGRGVVNAFLDDTDLPVLENVRPNLDVVPGGPKLRAAEPLHESPEIQNAGGLPAVFADKLGDLIDEREYEIVLIDTAPSRGIWQQVALAAARYVMVPIKTDQASWDGLLAVGPQVKQAQNNGNPDLTYLGVVITANNTSATSVLKRTRVFLGEAVGKIPMLDARIRSSETAAFDCRARGELAHEVADAANSNNVVRLKALRERKQGGPIDLPPALSATSGSLADDYQHLTREMLMRIHEAESTTSIAQGN